MSTAIVPAEPTALAPIEATQPGGDFLTDPNAMRHALNMAATLSRSVLVPERFRGKPEDVFAAILLARGMHEDLFTVLNAVHFVGGKPGWAAQFLIARANRSGRFRGGIRFRTSGQGADLAATAYATLADTGEAVDSTVTMAMAVADGWTKNSKYRSLPEQMLKYRAATFLIRLYCPEILFGYRPAEELEDIAAARSSGGVYTDPEPASPPRASRAAPLPPGGRETVTSAGSSVPSPGPEKVSGTSPPPESSPGPGDSERTTLLERVKELKKSHADIVRETATMMGLWNANEATNAQLATLLDAVTERIEREATQDEGTQPEGAQP